MSSPDPLLVQAIATHQRGEMPAARAMYQRILRRRPTDPDALNFLGMLEYQSGHQGRGVELLEQSVASAPDNPHAWLNLGNMRMGLRENEQAAEAYERATALAPSLWQAWYDRAICLRRLHRLEESIDCLRTALELNPDHDLAYERLGMLLYRAGKTQELADLYRDWVRYSPNNPTARHMQAAVSGTDALPARASDDYIRTTFDKYADSFEESLQDLGYRAPQLLSATLTGQLGLVRGAGLAKPDVLDAGVGTGLCGPLLRDLARTLVGVDLSPAMVEKAHARHLYDELVVAEIGAFMAARPAAFDVVVSADTLVYFGALEDVLAAAHCCLRPEGLLAFTVERLDPTVDAAAPPYRMGVHGRYLHAQAYLVSALTGAGFKVESVAAEVLRAELGVDVNGWVVVATRR